MKKRSEKNGKIKVEVSCQDKQKGIREIIISCNYTKIDMRNGIFMADKLTLTHTHTRIKNSEWILTIISNVKYYSFETAINSKCEWNEQKNDDENVCKSAANEAQVIS